MSLSDSEADPLVPLIEEFTERYRRGERPALSEYTARCPDHAERIRKIFPAMIVMERLGSDGAAASGSLTGRRDADKSPIPEILGEYRILRQIGRGGMGVVYEAVQESLGRHVALKVLVVDHLVRDTQLERFRREACAAARLHHSNIVPVFGVGDSDGTYYYAMQYIQGQSLDAVLDELRRLRGHDRAIRHDADGASAVTFGVARSLLSGWRSADPVADAEPLAHDMATEINTVQGPRIDQSNTSTSPESGSGSGLKSQPNLQYVRSIARIGIQIADALAYAHRQGVLHRDIKPANLLLDSDGTAWVADFGLAKLESASDLTTQGDIVGTLRYMAPERFSGQADARSDVYGLGLTLYELVTLRRCLQRAVAPV